MKLKSSKDGKRYKTDVANTEQLLRIIQSIPSPKAEPFKRWLSQIVRERIEETIEEATDPELTDEWKDRGVKTGKRVCNPDGRNHPCMGGFKYPPV